MSNVLRYYVEKKPGFDVEAQALFSDVTGFLGLTSLTALRLFVRYDIEGLNAADAETVCPVVLSEPMSDHLYSEKLPALDASLKLLCYESLPGQFDQRADSCAQCIQMMLGGSRPLVRVATILAVAGLDEKEFQTLSDYVINPVECGAASLDKPKTLHVQTEPPVPIARLNGFSRLDDDGLEALRVSMGLAMDLADLRFLRAFFEKEGRDPFETEMRVLDTYWSDHCRHTTFLTHLDEVHIDDERVASAYHLYLDTRAGLYGHDTDRPVTLMDMATCAMKALRKQGKLPHLDESEEINACTVRITPIIDGKKEDYLLLFKNETHNHPTEIEPFGGAATCVGGAIRDPLSGRSYVYHAMRITGSGDPRASLSDTLPGKRPQRQITTKAAAGFSSYGNQIGLATGLVREIYHPGYVAKRMEIGAVVGAAPQNAVRRETPQPGDVIILLGGRTGRDGIGGATGSSKSHSDTSVSTCAAEVQKGNAPEERKLQRLFRDPEVTRMIVRCNDFGAGGVAVAIGELCDGLRITLDRVPKKYEGLGATELAISESQERMAVVVSAQDADRLMRAAALENLEATIVAEVTEEPRMVMTFLGETAVDLPRSLLSSNGAPKHARVRALKAAPPPARPWDTGTPDKRLLLLASDLNFCSQRGLVERFDSTIGAGSVLVPFGGATGQCPAQAMAAKIPVLQGDCATCSVMSYAFDPDLSAADPFEGARTAVIESVAKLVAAGASPEDTYLTFQEYFPRLREDKTRWGLPLSALMGAFEAQMGLEIASIGGKDSMSGSFNELDVPPTLVSFAITACEAPHILSPEWKAAGHPVYLFRAESVDGAPDYAGLKAVWRRVAELSRRGVVVSAYASSLGGAAGALLSMSLGSDIGFIAENASDDWFASCPGGLVCECTEPVEGALLLGYTSDKPEIQWGKTFLPLDTLRAAWEAPLSWVFPTQTGADATPVPALSDGRRLTVRVAASTARPKAVIPVFPGTNCEYDTARALTRAGAQPEIVVVRNLTPEALEDSARDMERALRDAQMLVIPGGFSAGDEPDGSGKFIASFFRQARMTEAVRALLHTRDGLILGICNGFQALIKLGLVPFGDIRDMDGACPTLTFNTIGRHQSKYVHTRVASTLSPWLSRCAPGDIHAVPVSHGEGRFVAPPDVLDMLIQNGQIAFQYCDAAGAPSMDTAVNPNASLLAIEGIVSPDGRVLGKMGHTERSGPQLAKNVPGEKYQPLFGGGVDYFR